MRPGAQAEAIKCNWKQLDGSVREYNLEYNPLIQLIVKKFIILTNEKTNRTLRVLQPVSRNYRRIIF